ncbi:MAG TPA: Hsp20/alpha crystallin family protein [Synechococcus sp. M44_DOE_062]|nr:Hsp20/alpha crystallin family protein [Synechococcus sp. M44_DOE_062]
MPQGRGVCQFGPLLEVQALRQEPSSPRRERSRSLLPTPLQVWESGAAYTVQLWVPGADRERFNIEATAQQLSISGEIQVHGPEGAELRHQEVEPQPFQRILKLAHRIQPEKVSATYRDGILTLTLPKADAARVVKVQVGASSPTTAAEAVAVESQPA